VAVIISVGLVIFVLGILHKYMWGSTGSLVMLEYEVKRSPMSSQGAALFWGSLDLSRPWESLDEIYKRSPVVG